MGGIGSGKYEWWNEPRSAAEDFGMLDVSKLKRLRVFERERDDIPCLLETRAGAYRGLVNLSVTFGSEELPRLEDEVGQESAAS